MYGVFVGIGIAGTITSAFLPETLGQDFPDTIEDVERRKWNKFFSFRVWKDHRKSQEKNDSAVKNNQPDA